MEFPYAQKVSSVKTLYAGLSISIKKFKFKYALELNYWHISNRQKWCEG
jgi:hypothetical protein